MGSIDHSLLGVDVLVESSLDVAAGEVALHFAEKHILAAGFSLAIVVVVIIFYFPVEVVVRNVGVIHVLFTVGLVRVGGDDGDQGEENDSDL